jgi:hypothetical protein
MSNLILIHNYNKRPPDGTASEAGGAAVELATLSRSPEGNGWTTATEAGVWYIHRRCLRTTGFQHSVVPGLCVYKVVYLWMHHRSADGAISKALGWRYVLPNPLLPFIAFRVALPGQHPDLQILEDG